MITVFPKEFGSPVMKSRAMLSKTAEGIGSGCKRPAGVKLEDFICWQIWHRLTND
ncbi:hypothetical protein HanRHA438_Chr04g0182731 [Helianthus annuus]|nr:hypothetical protein HanRHA438_Chr04g0182731 [Helianthus annuus]